MDRSQILQEEEPRLSEWDEEFKNTYGFPLQETYRHALKFYKESEAQCVNLHYDNRLRLVAYTQQSHHGNYSEDKVAPLGAFDVIGKDRRNAWASLGNVSRAEAMKLFVEEVVKILPHLRSYLISLKEAEEEMSKKREQEAKDQQEATKAERLAEVEGQRQEEQRRKVQDALNKQTFSQFKSYAEQQYPDDPDRQAIQIRQLQEQHYRQYMQEVYQRHMENQVSQAIMTNSKSEKEDGSISPNGLSARLAVGLSMGDEDHRQGNDVSCTADDVCKDDKDAVEFDDPIHGEEEDDHECTEACGFCEDEMAPASMWTKKELNEFKASIRKEGGEGFIKVGHGETVTVRVPTHPEGNALFWEFATDSYDIAFGLFFEWTDSDENEITVHISDSEDEDLDEYAEENGDPETGSDAMMVSKGPPTSMVVPIYRRDCHEEVYAGTHNYPGKGVYLLKFDNTYSLWRSKTLYYRVYYTK